MKKTFQGYLRPDGSAGVRNLACVISTVSCANTVSEKIARECNAIPVIHDNGCLQLGEDLELTQRMLSGVAQNPNVGAVLFVSLGCESIDSKGLINEVGKTRPVELVVIQDAGGSNKAVIEGVKKLQALQKEIENSKRVEIGLEKLSIGLKCGGSDFTTAIASNSAVGITSDLVVQNGGTVFLTETPGFAGSEHLLARQAETPQVAQQVYRIVDRYRDEVKQTFGKDINEGNPSPGNIAGGITTLVEKSIGTIKKIGTTPIKGVISMGEFPEGPGAWIIDTPGLDIMSVSGAAASGANIILFTTGRGTPLGCAIAPVIKITGNTESYMNFMENIDVNSGTIVDGEETISEVGERIFNDILDVANGN